MSIKETLTKKLKDKSASIAILGLGYVGLPLALSFADKGFTTYGFDLDINKINMLRRKTNYLHGEEWLDPFIEKHVGKTFIPEEKITDYDVAFIDVPTPYDKSMQKPVYDHVISSGKNLGKTMQKGSLIILESTVGPGTTKGLLRDILEGESKLKVSKDFGLGFSPERINPNDSEHRIYNTPKVVAGYDKLSTDMAAHLYEQIVPYVFKLYDPTEGEMVKLFENVQRDVNLALTNEMAKICAHLGIDVINVINGASTKWNFYRLIPGCGVGGHCLPEDPYFLLDKLPNTGQQCSIIRDAREINDSMPLYTVEMTLADICNNGKDISSLKVAVLGLSYKKNTGDLRTSPAETIVKELQKRSVKTIAHDPYINNVPWVSTSSLDGALTDADAVILCTDHDQFDNLPEKISQLAPESVFVDGRNRFCREEFESRGIRYIGIGR